MYMYVRVYISCRESLPIGVPSSVLLPTITESLPLVMKDGKVSSSIIIINTV